MTLIQQYNGELLARQSDLISKGRLEAAEHRPPSDATRCDQHEAEAQAEGEKWIAAAHHALSIDTTEASRSAGELQQKLLELKGKLDQLLADDSLKSTVSAEMADERQALVVATEARLRAQVDLRSFRARHAITEPAQYPDSRIWHFAIIAALALIETMVNAFFYENAQGLLGGFTVALGVAAVNMVGALLLGMLFRYKNVADLDKRVAGWACLVAFVVLSIYCNALFAAFRAEYQLLTDPTDAGQLRQAFRAAAEAAGGVFILRMQFGDFMSFILFGIGLLLSCFAFYKGYTFDDPYPGHGPKDRVLKAAFQVEHSKQDGLRQRIKDLLQRRRHNVQAMIHEPMQLANAAGSRIAALEHAQSHFWTKQEAIQRDFALMLRSYRDANTAVRGTPTPPHFGNTPDLRLPPNSEMIAGVAQTIGSVQKGASLLHFQNQNAINQKLNDLQEHGARILNETVAAFIASVERDAETNINKHIQSIHADLLSPRDA